MDKLEKCKKSEELNREYQDKGLGDHFIFGVEDIGMYSYLYLKISKYTFPGDTYLVPDYIEALHIECCGNKRLKIITISDNIKTCEKLCIGGYLEHLDLSEFDSSNAVSGENMVTCTMYLVSIDLSNFNTSKMISMSNMFSLNSKLESLDLSSFDTRNVENMSHMFSHSYNLKEINLSSFDVSRVRRMQQMFYTCVSLKELDVEHFDTKGNLYSMSLMFEGCNAIRKIDLRNLNPGMKVHMWQAFSHCYELCHLRLPKFSIFAEIHVANVLDHSNNIKVSDVKGELHWKIRVYISKLIGGIREFIQPSHENI